MSENRRTQNWKRSQKSIIGNTTPLHHEEEETVLTNKGTANEVEVVDPDIMEDSHAEVCQDSTDDKSNQSLDNQTSRKDQESSPACPSFGTKISAGERDSNLDVWLARHDLWQKFNQIGTEMLLTKAGRLMFPCMEVYISGMVPNEKYSISLELIPMDNSRYRFVRSKWLHSGDAFPLCEEKLRYIHPDSPSKGKSWMSNKVSFKTLKLTNNKQHKRCSVVVLNSMQKYIPRLVISKYLRTKCQTAVFTKDFPVCAFMGVTTYQSTEMIRLKIEHNPRARAFREEKLEADSALTVGRPALSPHFFQKASFGSNTLNGPGPSHSLVPIQPQMRQWQPVAANMPCYSKHYPPMQQYVHQGCSMWRPVPVPMPAPSTWHFQDFHYPKFAHVVQPPEQRMLQQQQYKLQPDYQQLQPELNCAPLLDSTTMPDWIEENDFAVDDDMPLPYHYGGASTSRDVEGQEEQH